MRSVDPEFTVFDGVSYLHMRLKGARFATESVLISKSEFLLEWRIKKAQERLLAREKLMRKYFVEG